MGDYGSFFTIRLFVEAIQPYVNIISCACLIGLLAVAVVSQFKQ